jgi:signal transduction histidine kinase
MTAMIAISLPAARVLIVDDEHANVRLLEQLLEDAGYTTLRSLTDARQVLTTYAEFQPDLLLLDLRMPYLDGVQILEQLRPQLMEAYVPVLMLTADVTPEAKTRALQAGTTDFLTKPFDRVEAILRIRNLLETRRLYLELASQNRSLEQMVRDRTERLLQSEKVATMGSLLAGIAHELNNPLAILMGHTELLRGKVSDAALVQRTEKIDEAARRCVRIVRNFLALARQRPPERGDVAVNPIIQGAIELLAYELRTDDVEVVLDLADGLPVLWADPHQLHQVFVNLIGNAHHAIRRMQGRRRRITVRTRSSAAEGRGVRIEISDTGPGIPPEIQQRIFAPFFTTKPVGEGTGLGLSLCRSIIEEHEGTIAVESAPEAGATFRIDLAAPVRPPVAQLAAIEEALPPITPKIILVVDDERDMALLLAEAFAADGHAVDICGNGAEALERLARRPYDLIVTDTKMPVLDGEGLYRELERRLPAHLRPWIIFLTGDVLTRGQQEFLEATGAPFLAKPFDLGQIRRLVHELFTGSSDRAAGGGSTR